MKIVMEFVLRLRVCNMGTGVTPGGLYMSGKNNRRLVADEPVEFEK